jgi:hypothetical protein
MSGVDKFPVHLPPDFGCSSTDIRGMALVRGPSGILKGINGSHRAETSNFSDNVQ